MLNNFTEIHELLQDRADFQARLNLQPYDGIPEVKTRNGRKYLYVRRRDAGRLTSTYVGTYSDELYQLLRKDARDAHELKKHIRQLDKKLSQLGYSDVELSTRVQRNLDFARANMKSSIYDQAILEGIGATFFQTEDVIENRIISGMKASDVQKILNLKHAWDFILDERVIRYPSDFSLLCYIARLVNAGFYYNGGRVRGVPVTIRGTSYVPPLPAEHIIKEQLEEILLSHLPVDEKAISLCLFSMKSQIFNDGNKRTAVIFANHYLISQGAGLLVIPAEDVSEFRKRLVAYYEGSNASETMAFMKNNCIKTF